MASHAGQHYVVTNAASVANHLSTPGRSIAELHVSPRHRPAAKWRETSPPSFQRGRGRGMGTASLHPPPPRMGFLEGEVSEPAGVEEGGVVVPAPVQPLRLDLVPPPPVEEQGAAPLHVPVLLHPPQPPPSPPIPCPPSPSHVPHLPVLVQVEGGHDGRARPPDEQQLGGVEEEKQPRAAAL